MVPLLIWFSSWTEGKGMLNGFFRGRRKYYVVAAFFLLVPVVLAAAVSNSASGESRVDMLEIELPDRTKMPAVTFLHDQHTGAMPDQGCETCHPQENGKYVFDYKKAGTLAYEAATAFYHDDCAGCHRKMASGGKEAGPRIGQCRECHVEETGFESAWKPIEFDRSLHFRHVNAEAITFKPEQYDQNCGACHHVYDEKLEKTVYRKGEEGSCRYCHLEQKKENTRSYREAAHDSCVNCHKGLSARGTKTGPVDCAGCHSAKGQAKIDTLKDVPRLKTKQPDAVLMAAWLDEAEKQDKLPDQLTFPVAFNHVGHEAAVGSCRQCHHASMDRCDKCHTSRGDKEGGFVSLETAMHSEKSAIGCIGCHEQVKEKADCAGCHDQMADKPFADRDCRQCHAVPPETLKPLPLDAETRREIARTVVAERRETPERVPDEKIPEKVKIDIMVDEYQAAEFPHRKIVHALAERTKENDLATAFHQKPETLCMGCHHNSPASLNPPRCASCHKVAGPQADGRPGLLGAYHGQCIGCHTKMNIEKPAATDCAACHKKRSVETR